MTADDRPSVTDNARAEAWDEGYQDGLRQGGEGEDGPRYVNPYRAAGRAETTTATTEDAARLVRQYIDVPFSTALVLAHALADEGLLATARTRPTCGATTNDAGPCVLDPDHVTVSAHAGPSGWSWNDDVTMARFGDDEEG